MNYLAALAHLALVSPGAVCGPAIQPGPATAPYYVTAVPMDEDIDEPDTDPKPPSGSCTAQGIGEQPKTADNLFSSVPDIV